MNDEMEQFEKLLKDQPLRRVPAEWRKEILAAAGKARKSRSQAVASQSLFSILNRRLGSLLWPHPVAWAGLAAIWLFILAVNFSIRDKTPALAEKTLPPSPQVVAELKQQKQLLAELMGPGDVPDADRPKIFTPKPRSERMGILTA